jgi:hypothetical protein
MKDFQRVWHVRWECKYPVVFIPAGEFHGKLWREEWVDGNTGTLLSQREIDALGGAGSGVYQPARGIDRAIKLVGSSAQRDVVGRRLEALERIAPVGGNGCGANRAAVAVQ